MSLADAFNLMLNLKKRNMKLYRVGAAPANEGFLDVSPSSFQRKLDGPADSIVEGRQFIISKKNFTACGFVGPIKRGDKLYDVELGVMTIDQIEDLYDIGGAIIGWRVSTT